MRRLDSSSESTTSRNDFFLFFFFGTLNIRNGSLSPDAIQCVTAATEEPSIFVFFSASFVSHTHTHTPKKKREIKPCKEREREREKERETPLEQPRNSDGGGSIFFLVPPAADVVNGASFCGQVTPRRHSSYDLLCRAD